MGHFKHDLERLVWSGLSPSQTDLQLVASSRKLNLRRDLRLVAKRTGKFLRKFTQVAKKFRTAKM